MQKYKHASMRISTKATSAVNCTAFNRRSESLLIIYLIFDVTFPQYVMTPTGRPGECFTMPVGDPYKTDTARSCKPEPAGLPQANLDIRC